MARRGKAIQPTTRSTVTNRGGRGGRGRPAPTSSSTPAVPENIGYDANGAPVIRDYSGSGQSARKAYSQGQSTDYGRLVDYAAGGGDISGYAAPEQMFSGADYRKYQGRAMDQWNAAQAASTQYASDAYDAAAPQREADRTLRQELEAATEAKEAQRIADERAASGAPEEAGLWETPIPNSGENVDAFPGLSNPEAIFGKDPSLPVAPIDTSKAKQYRDALAAGTDTSQLQKDLGINQPLRHTQGYSNPALEANRAPKYRAPQLATGAPQGRVAPVSKGMNYLQSIQPQGGGQPSSGGSTMMSQALRGGGTGQGGVV